MQKKIIKYVHFSKHTNNIHIERLSDCHFSPKWAKQPSVTSSERCFSILSQMHCCVCKPDVFHIVSACVLCGGWYMRSIQWVCDLAALAEAVHGVAVVYLCCCCGHGSEEGCWWLLLPQGTHEWRQRPFLPAGWAHPALLVVRGSHLLSPGAPLRAPRPPPLEAAAGQLHPAIQGQPRGPAHSAAPVRGGKRSRDQSGHFEAPLGLFWSFLLCGHGGLHYW